VIPECFTPDAAPQRKKEDKNTAAQAVTYEQPAPRVVATPPRHPYHHVRYVAVLLPPIAATPHSAAGRAIAAAATRFTSRRPAMRRCCH